jgi:hypothetical protein
MTERLEKGDHVDVRVWAYSRRKVFDEFSKLYAKDIVVTHGL